MIYKGNECEKQTNATKVCKISTKIYCKDVFVTKIDEHSSERIR